MRIKNNTGAVDALLIPLIISVVLVVGLAVFGVWAYFQDTDQRNNVEDIVAEAVVEANAAKEEELNAKFAEENKKPYDNYTSPSSLGSVSITYPRTWSAYIEETGGSSSPLEGFFHPKFVPAEKDTAYALRITLESRDYDREVSSFTSDIEKGTVTSKPIKIEGVTGVLLDGEIDSKISGSKLLIPLRDKTLTIWTEAPSFVKDFKNIIIKNLTFVP